MEKVVLARQPRLERDLCLREEPVLFSRSSSRCLRGFFCGELSTEPCRIPIGESNPQLSLDWPVKWRDSPASVEPRRNLRPRVASRSKWARIEALLRNRAFAIEYASARDRWRNGIAAVFPPGTYWLQRFAAVPVLET